MPIEVAVFYEEDTTTLVRVIARETDISTSWASDQWFDSFLEALNEATKLANQYKTHITIEKETVPRFSSFVSHCISEKEQNIYRASCGEMVFIED